MKKRFRQEEVSRYQDIINQLLTLYFSGVYINSDDILNISNELEFSMPSKSRELLLKNLFLEAEKSDKLDKLYELLIKLLMKRVNEYKSLQSSYPSLVTVSSNWIFKATTLIKLLQSKRVANPYGV